MKINNITTVVGSIVKYYKIGNEVNGIKIHHFKEVSVEWDKGIDFIYHAVNEENQVIVSIENCPVVVEYEKE